MRKSALVLGVVFVVLAIVVLVLADGLRRWYSGLFFALMGIVALSYAFRRRHGHERGSE